MGKNKPRLYGVMLERNIQLSPQHLPNPYFTSFLNSYRIYFYLTLLLGLKAISSVIHLFLYAISSMQPIFSPCLSSIILINYQHLSSCQKCLYRARQTLCPLAPPLAYFALNTLDSQM